MRRTIRNRLNRISNALKTRQTSPSSIDVTLAKSLLDDLDRLDHLSLERNASPTVSQSTEDEMRELRRRINEISGTITDENYGALQAREDKRRLFKLSGKLTNVEILEKVQLRLKLFAYGESAEPTCRSRILELKNRLFMADIKNDRLTYGLSAEEQAELDGLLARYPDLPLDPRAARFQEALTEALERHRGTRR